MAKGPPTSATVFVTAIALTDYNSPTDRGTQSLPAWRMHLRDVTGDIYVLAVSPSARYELPERSGMYDAGHAAAERGRTPIDDQLHRASRVHRSLRSGYRSSLRVTQTRTAISAGRHHCVRAGAAGPERGGSPASGASAVVPAPPIPGAPGTRAITLAEPLGGRVVVDDRGTPYVVSASLIQVIVTRRLAPTIR